jgi:hypothetical protein
MKNLVLILFVTAIFAGCTEQSRAKKWGGDAVIDLPVCQKLFDLTWKGSDLWYATHEMGPNDTVENYTFAEKSSWGLMEGTVTFREYRHKTKCPPPHMKE